MVRTLEPLLRTSIVEAARALREAERPIRVLRSVSWPRSTKLEFFERGARELPSVTYAPFDDHAEVRARIAKAEGHIVGEGPIQDWLRRQATAIAGAANLLAARGTPEFLTHGAQLYGLPKDPLPDGLSTTLDLAHTVDGVARDVASIDLGAPAPACHLASGVARRLQQEVQARFGADAPSVEIVDELNANAIAGARSIRIRRNANFTDKDVEQLIQHEAFVHVCTSLNGRQQEHLPILAAGHPGTTRTQEGLAVFAEFITGAIEPDRFRRLADRVLAIQMAIEGADFLEVYRFFQTRAHTDEQAYENARRVFRGGVLRGGAPFVKDVVYLDGMLRVLNFMRSAVAEGRADCLLLLFCGKLDLLDLPALSHLQAAGLCRPPKYLPPWLEDRRFLVAHLTLSRFLNRVDMNKVRDHYRELLSDIVRPGDDAGDPR